MHTTILSCLAAMTAILSMSAALQPPPDGNSLVRVTAIASAASVRPGQTFVLAFRFEIEPHWHIYWANAGYSGAPTSISVDAPDGFEVGEILWPVPHAIGEGDMVSYGYERAATLFVPVTAAAGAPAGEVTLKSSINWLVCMDICLSGDARTTTAIRIEGDAVKPMDDQEALDAVRFDNPSLEANYARLPRPLDGVNGAEIRVEGPRVIISGPAEHESKELEFFPNSTPGVSTRLVSAAIENGRFEVVLDWEFRAANAQGEEPQVRGVVALRGPDAKAGWAAYDVAAALPKADEAVRSTDR